MAYPKSFDPDTALERAMELFWKEGYEATSIDDLTNHLGITRPALYRQWGSKQDLYQAALQLYRSRAGRAFVDALRDRPAEAIATVRSRLGEIVAEALENPGRGCFLVNAAMERSTVDPATKSQVAAGLEGLRDTLVETLCIAKETGAISHPDPAALARYIVVVIQGLRVVGKALPDRAALDGVVEQAMAPLALSDRF